MPDDNSDESKRHLFPWKWCLRKTKFTGDAGKVFSCFAGGGGSSMGWKLAGFDVIGCCEIDRRMAACYVANLGPRMLFCEPIQDFRRRKSLPNELFDLDVLDGSPPCSSFSLAGVRERDWGKKKVFREGQAEQVLDTLFFDFIALTDRLQPKIVVAENVPGLLIGEAKGYFDRIKADFRRAGYEIVWRVINASRMGIPQRRRRVFIIGLRRDIIPRLSKASRNPLFDNIPILNLRFDESPIPFGSVRTKHGSRKGMTSHIRTLMSSVRKSDRSLKDINLRVRNKCIGTTWAIVPDHTVCPTITAGPATLRLSDRLFASRGDIIAVSSWPTDYDFLRQNVRYVCGMSVPPVMMAQVACRIRDQWLRRLP